MNTTITIGYLPMPERTAVELKADYDQLQSSIEHLVNTYNPVNTPAWVVADFKDMRRKQLAIESELKSLFN